MAKKKTTSKTTKAPEPIVVNQIIVKSPQRKVYDVGQWRNALKSADTGRVKQLYDLYDDILIDGLLADAMDKRIDAVLNAELTFQDADGQEVPEITSIIDTPDWEELLRQIMYGRFYGRSGIELLCTPDSFHIAPIPPKHINLRTRSILINDSDEKGIPYEGDNSLLILGKERNYGLLLKATPYAIYKRGGFGDWSQWVELFGMPQRVGKYNAYDPESRKLLERAMEEAGSAPWIIIPKEAEVETKASNNGSGTSYNEFRQACNEEILITILGQTLTTVQGEKGARSLGEVHREVEEGKNRSDMRFVQRVLNNRILPMLEARGYPVSGGKFVFPKSAEQLSVSDIVMLSDILPIPQSYLHEKYSIPVPEEEEPIARREAAAFDAVDITPEETENTTPNLAKANIKNADKSLKGLLRRFFALAPTKMGATSSLTIPTNFSDDTLDNRIIKRVASNNATYFDAELFATISKDLLNAIHTAFKKPLKHADGYVYDDLDPAFVTALEQNIFHFSAAKTLAEIQQLNQEFRKAKSFEEYYKQALNTCAKYNKNWGRTEYSTAVLTAESAANYQRLSAKTDRFPFWQYVTLNDGKVREEHQKLHGVTLKFNDPLWDKIFPPNGWNCRCRVRPLMKFEVTKNLVKESAKKIDEYFDSDDWEKIENSHFAVNPGKRAEIFNNNQMYVRNFLNDAAKLMEKVKPSDYGCEDDYKKIIATSSHKVNSYEGTAKDWWKEHKTIVNNEEVLLVKDYYQREWIMRRKEFDTHTSNITKSREFRTQYLDCINEVMQSPDEIWLGQSTKDNQQKDYQLTEWHLVKYYNDVAIVCVCKIQKSKMSFKSWYLLEDNNVRKGILVYHK